MAAIGALCDSLHQAPEHFVNEAVEAELELGADLGHRVELVVRPVEDWSGGQSQLLLL